MRQAEGQPAYGERNQSLPVPSLSLEPADGKLTVSMGVERGTPRTDVPLLSDVLNGIERLAADDGRKALVIFDEFQQVIAEAVEKAERQIRAAVQTHRNVGYVFAGSGTRMMTEMIASSARAFWRLGDPLYPGPIPRNEFIPFLRDGLESTGARVEDAAILRILDASEDVPYNVQQLASACWNRLRERPGGDLGRPRLFNSRSPAAIEADEAR